MPQFQGGCEIRVVGVESLDSFVAHLDAENRAEEAEQCFPVGIAAFGEPSEQEQHSLLWGVEGRRSLTSPLNVERSSRLLDKLRKPSESIDYQFGFAFPSSCPGNDCIVGDECIGFRSPSFDLLFENLVDDGGPLTGSLHDSCLVDRPINSSMDRRIVGDDSRREDKLLVEDEIETHYEKELTPIGNSAKAGVPKENRGQKALVIILIDD